VTLAKKRPVYKSVWVKPETHRALWELRVKLRARSMDELIRTLIRRAGCAGQ